MKEALQSPESALPIARSFGIDILERPQLVDTWLEKLDLRGRVHLYYRTSQDNRDVIHQAIGNLWHQEDRSDNRRRIASVHQLSQNFRDNLLVSFETAVSIVLKDWSWAHSPGDFCRYRRSGQQ